MPPTTKYRTKGRGTRKGAPTLPFIKGNEMTESTQQKLLSIYDIARQIGADSRLLEKWHKDESIQTPEPNFATSSQEYWLESDVFDWAKIFDTMVAQSTNVDYAFATLVDKLAAKAKEIKRYADRAGAYRSGRDFTKGRAKELVHEVIGMQRLVASLNEFGIQPKEKKDEINACIAAAKEKLGMD
jgi:hypothetical protein